MGENEAMMKDTKMTLALFSLFPETKVIFCSDITMSGWAETTLWGRSQKRRHKNLFCTGQDHVKNYRHGAQLYRDHSATAICLLIRGALLHRTFACIICSQSSVKEIKYFIFFLSKRVLTLSGP